jgi:hypothetical protein
MKEVTVANQIDALHAKIYGNTDPRTIKHFAKCSEIRRAHDLAKRELRQAEKAARLTVSV